MIELGILVALASAVGLNISVLRNHHVAREIGVVVQPPKGTIYVWAPVPEGHTSVSFAELVLEEAAVVVSPGSMYGPSGEGFFRISVTTPDERLTEGLERIRPPPFELAWRARDRARHPGRAGVGGRDKHLRAPQSPRGPST